jgi:UDP-2,4-diacetamido-2,4,6-trideoxy-beta-L-altropyranose hydrolase
VPGPGAEIAEADRLMKRAVIVANASVSVGGGHLRRCLSLGKSLAAAGWKVIVAASDPAFATMMVGPEKIDVVAVQEYAAKILLEAFPDGCDLLIVDHYGLDASFETGCRGWAKLILVVDDLADRRHDCDILLDQTPDRQISAYQALIPVPCQFLAGARYALLRPNFGAMGKVRRPTAERVQRGHISFGATDPDDMTSIAIGAFESSGLKLQLDIILGGGAPHIERVKAASANFAGGEAKVHVEISDPASIVRHADIAMGAGGVSALERCCLGIPSLIVSVADNQTGNAVGIARAGAAEFVGKKSEIDCSMLASRLRELAGDSKRREAMAACGRELCDGLGSERVADLIDRSGRSYA